MFFKDVYTITSHTIVARSLRNVSDVIVKVQI